MVTMDWGKDPSSGFISLYIGTLSEDVTEALMNDVHSPSDYNEASGIYTVGTHNLALPLTVDQAYSACTCSPTGCTLGFKYI